MSIWQLSELSIQPRTSLSKLEGDFIHSSIHPLTCRGAAVFLPGPPKLRARADEKGAGEWAGVGTEAPMRARKEHRAPPTVAIVCSSSKRSLLTQLKSLLHKGKQPKRGCLNSAVPQKKL